MRYFSQLARETRARVMPSRQPSWLQPLAPMVQESTVESVTPESAPTSALMRAAPDHEAHHQSGKQEPGRSAGDGSARAEAPVHAHASTARLPEEVTRSPLPSHKSSKQEQDRDTITRPSANGTFAFQLTAELPLGHGEPRLLPPAVPPLSDPPARAAERLPATLQGVLTEIARRQKELEIRYQADRWAAHNGSSPLDSVPAGEPARRESEAVLNIGSIVVQVEPEPEAKAPARPAPRRPGRENNSWWARSFLDR
jgi:hypothetical protein